MKRPETVIGAALVAVLFTLSPFAAGSAEGPLKPSPKDKCPVCGMFVAKYVDWIAGVTFKDGSSAIFDGAKDMFKYLFAIKKYAPARNRQDIEKIYVTDYYTLKMVDGTRAHYVIGSDVFGPMGRELIPFAREADAREFLNDHNGKRILTFKEVTQGIVASLD
ncbi:MAG: nitrous oxide reductase accessory protein NosL [Nitrospirota bacterium]